MAATVITGNGSSSGGGTGYRGTWAAGTYAEGAIVRRGPFVWGSTASTTQDPCVVEGTLSTLADWQPRGDASQATARTMILASGGGQNGTGFRLATNSGWDGRRLVIDAMCGPSGGADALSFGILDSTTSTASAGTGGIVGLTGAYGVEVDIWNDRTQSIVNGVSGNPSSTYYNATAQPTGAGNEGAETSDYQRFFLDMWNNAGTLEMRLYRSKYIANSSNQENLSLLATYTLAASAPAFTTWRFVIGARSGGTAGEFRVMNAWTQYKPGSGDWDLISMFPHVPHYDSAIF